MGGWASIVKSFFQIHVFQEKLYPPLYAFFGKAGPFTLESHSHVKAVKMQGFPDNYRCLIKPLFKQHTHNFSRGYPMNDPDQILNNVIVSMVPYCPQNAQNFLGHFF